MTEEEYLDATNLAKAQIAHAAIKDMLFLDDQPENEARQSIAQNLLRLLVSDLIRRASIDPT